MSAPQGRKSRFTPAEKEELPGGLPWGEDLLLGKTRAEYFV